MFPSQWASHSLSLLPGTGPARYHSCLPGPLPVVFLELYFRSQPKHCFIVLVCFISSKKPFLTSQSVLGVPPLDFKVLVSSTIVGCVAHLIAISCFLAWFSLLPCEFCESSFGPYTGINILRALFHVRQSVCYCCCAGEETGTQREVK